MRIFVFVSMGLKPLYK